MGPEAYCPYCEKNVAIICGNCGNSLKLQVSLIGSISGIKISKCNECKIEKPICSECKGPITIVNA